MSESSSIMNRLATHGLQTLEVELETMYSKYKAYLDCSVCDIGRLTALTRLEMRYFRPIDYINITLIQALPVQELVFLECRGLEVQLIVPGAFSSLRKLHIEESRYGHSNHTGKQLTACGSALLSLPHLSQLSGSCALFESGLKDELKGWRVSAYKRGLMTSKNLPKDWIANELKMWSRF